MADNTDWFADVAAVLDADAEAPDISEDVDSPSADSTPDDAEPIAAEDPAEDQTLEADASDDTEAEGEDAVFQATSEPETPAEDAAAPQVSWDSPDNPYYAQAEALAEKAKKADAYEALIRMQAQQRAQQLQAERLRTLADDDPQRATELQNFVVEQQQPYVQQAKALEGEVETVAKAATVLDAAMRLYVPPDLQSKIDAEVERLMRLPGGYSVLQNHIQTRQEFASQVDAELAAVRAENARLQKQLAAKAQIAQRQQSGADVVDSGPGIGGSFADRWAAATGTDAIDVILDSLATTG